MLVIDGNYLSHEHLEPINQFALAFHSAGARVLIIECIPHKASIVRKQKLHLLGFAADDFIQVQERYEENYDFQFINTALKLAEEKSTVVLTGSAMVMQKMRKHGLIGMLYA